MQTAIPCTMMRGGTSRGPYFKAADLPSDIATRDRVLLAVMGSPDARQIDGIGGATSLTSKVAIVSPSDHPHADVDYLFAQVSIDQAFVDTAPSCGNMLSGVGPFAIENAMLEAQDGETLVRIRNVNTDSLIDAIIQTPGGQVEYEGATAIDGVPGTAAPVVLNFREIVGTKTGALLPTGNAKDTIEGVEVTCIDVAMPMVIMAASSLGKTGHESKAELDADEAFLARMEGIRLAAGQLMGLGDVSGKVVPKVALLAGPRHHGNITSRYFVPDSCHAAHAVTGAICVAITTAVKGSVADGLARTEPELEQGLPNKCSIEHPSGSIEITLDLDQLEGSLRVNSAGVIRTTRKLFSGEVYLPAAIWEGA
ncbi:MAG: 4-oxalomesaconate tautomerase [Candidatus Thiodiazotropha sp.]